MTRFERKPQTPAQFVKRGQVIEVEGKYLTESGKIISRDVWAKTPYWTVEGDDYKYRNFFEAYHGMKY